MRIIAIGRVVSTPDDRIASRAIVPLLTTICSYSYAFHSVATLVEGFHLWLCRASRTLWRESIIWALKYQRSCRCISTLCRVSTTSDYCHTPKGISTSTWELGCEPCTQRMCDYMDASPIDTVTVGDISYDGVDKCEILITTPAVGASIWETSRVGDDEVTLAFESHISFHHTIAIGSAMYRDDEFRRIGATVARRHSEYVAASFASYGQFVSPTTESFWCGTSFWERWERRFCVAIFADFQDQFACFTSSHGSRDRVARRVKESIFHRKVLIRDIPRIAIFGSESVHPESHGECLEDCDRIVRLKCPILKTFDDTKFDPFAHIRMIPYGSSYISKTRFELPSWSDSLCSEEDFQYLGTGDGVVWTKSPISVSRDDAFSGEFVYRVTIKRCICIAKSGGKEYVEWESEKAQKGENMFHKKKVIAFSITFFLFLPNIFRENSHIAKTLYTQRHAQKTLKNRCFTGDCHHRYGALSCKLYAHPYFRSQYPQFFSSFLVFSLKNGCHSLYRRCWSIGFFKFLRSRYGVYLAQNLSEIFPSWTLCTWHIICDICIFPRTADIMGDYPFFRTFHADCAIFSHVWEIYYHRWVSHSRPPVCMTTRVALDLACSYRISTIWVFFCRLLSSSSVVLTLSDRFWISALSLRKRRSRKSIFSEMRAIFSLSRYRETFAPLLYAPCTGVVCIVLDCFLDSFSRDFLISYNFLKGFCSFLS